MLSLTMEICKNTKEDISSRESREKKKKKKETK